MTNAPPRLPGLIPLVVALTAAAAILVAVYPGLMSYDSVRALEEARSAVRGGDYPPFVSYVWRVFDFVWPGPSLMLFAQDFLLVFAFASILRTLRYPALLVVAGALLFCLVPPILGPMLVVWKDIGVSACLCAGVACFLAAERARRPALAIASGVVMLAFGAAYRWNAITALVPLAAWFAWRGGFADLPRGRAIAAGGALLAGITLFIGILNSYRLPDFVRLPPPLGAGSIMVHDLVAMSALCGRDLVPHADPATRSDDAVEYYRRIYDPRHVQLMAGNDREGRLATYFAVPEPIVRAAYFAAIRDEPLTYLAHRTAVFRELVGLGAGRTYIPTNVGVAENDLGVTHHPTRLTRYVLRYVWDASANPAGKPWLYYLIAALALVVAILRHGASERAAAVAVATSGVCYLVPLYFVTPAADVRYNHWSLVCAMVVVAIALSPRRVE